MGKILECVLRKARLQNPSALAIEPSNHVLFGQLLFSENHALCVAAGFDGFLELHGSCEGCYVYLVHLEDR